MLRDGAVFEQAGVNFSHVMGTKLPPSATAQRPELADAQWSRPASRSSFIRSIRTSRRRTPTCASSRATQAGQRSRLVVRRRLRSHAVLSVRRGRAALASHRAAGVRAVRRRRLTRAQGVVRPIFLPQASQRDARRRRAVLRRSERVGLRALLRLPAQRRRSLPAGVSADRRAPPATFRTASASAASSCIVAGVMSNSISYTTAALRSACSPAGAPNRF